MKRGLATILLMLANPAVAQDSGMDPVLANPVLANVQLSDPVQEMAATQLMVTLRCIQCQGQSIADSDAPIAAAMRSEVRVRIQKGESAESIRAWMISRYGTWISFDPPMSGGTALLWMTPLILLFAGLWMARGLFRKPPV